MHFHRNIKLVANCLPRSLSGWESISNQIFIFHILSHRGRLSESCYLRQKKREGRISAPEMERAQVCSSSFQCGEHSDASTAYYAENPPARDRAESPFTEHWLASQYSVLGNRRGAESEFYDIFRAYLDIESDISTQKILSATHELYWPAQIETKFTSFSRCVWTFWCLNWLLVNAR